MDQRGQGRDQMDVHFMSFVRRQRCPCPASRARLQSRQLPATPEPIDDWSLTSMKEKSIKIGAKVIGLRRYVAFQMAAAVVPSTLFADDAS
jgi:hypothetical protein